MRQSSRRGTVGGRACCRVSRMTSSSLSGTRIGPVDPGSKGGVGSTPHRKPYGDTVQTLRGAFSSVSTPIFAGKYETLVGQLLTRSTRFTCFCTAQTSIFQKIFVKLFRIFWQDFANFVIFYLFSLSFAQILMKISRNFAKYLYKMLIIPVMFISD